jgi:capsular exopolysaccharide synthesis family protein
VTFKDLLRLVRRRWMIATATAAAVLAGFWIFSSIKERPMYRGRARIQISTPPIYVTAAQGTQWVSIQQKDTATWISIIRSRTVLAIARQGLAERKVPVLDEWIDSISVVSEPGGQLVWIEAVAPTPDLAVEIANAVADATIAFSREDAGRDLKMAQEQAQNRAKEEIRVRQGEAERDRQVRARARAEQGAENLEYDVQRLREDISAQEARRRELERRLSTHRLRLERILSDRSLAEHLHREGLPRTGTLRSRVQESPRVRGSAERLEQLHRDLQALLRRYTEEHPQVRSARAEIREAELAHTRIQFEALGRDMDAEELTLRTESQLAEIELSVLGPELNRLVERRRGLAPLVEEVAAIERRMADSRTRTQNIQALLDNLGAAPVSGYVSELDRAIPKEAVPVELRLRKSWPVALLAALVVGISFAFLVEFIDTSIRTDFDVRRHLDWPVLAVVPRVSDADLLTLRAAPQSPVAEIYDTLATMLLSLPAAQPSRLFLLTSTNPQEGKSVASTNLAVAFARQGKRTLLVDGDMRMPSVHATFGLPNEAGFSSLLAGHLMVGAEGLIHETELPNLKVLPSGVIPDNPYELLDPVRVGLVAAQMREVYEVIVVDTPPVLRTGDALKLSTAADQVVFVVEAERTDQRQATWAKRLLANVNARVAGVLLNRAAREHEEYYYHSGYYSDRRGMRKEVRAT